MTDEASLRDLARIGAEMGESDGELFRLALRAFASPQSGDVGSEQADEFVAGQVYAEAPHATPDQAQAFAETFRNVFGIGDLDDVNDLLGRESHAATNYSGQLAFVRADR